MKLCIGKTMAVGQPETGPDKRQCPARGEPESEATKGRACKLLSLLTGFAKTLLFFVVRMPTPPLT